MAETIGLERDDAAAELARRTAMLDAVGYAATRIVGSGDWRPAIQDLLARLGAATDVSRVTLFEVHDGPDGRLGESCRYDWAAPGYAAAERRSRAIRTCRWSRTMGGSTTGPSGASAARWCRRLVAELTGYNRRRSSWSSRPCRSSPCRSCCATAAGASSASTIASTSAHWTTLEIDVLKTAAALIAGAIERTRIRRAAAPLRAALCPGGARRQ